MARPHPSLVDIASGRPVRPFTDPDDFVKSAIEHRMAGLAFWAVADTECGLDAAGKQRLAAYKLSAAARSAKLTSTIAGVLGLLDSIGVGAAVFKGVATEARWYPEPGTRPAADVDLFIDPAAHGKLDDIVDLLQPDHPLARSAQRLHDAGRLQGFDLDHNGIWVDFHVDPIKVGIPVRRSSEMWTRAESLDLGGFVCPVLDVEASLLQAVIHLQKDRFSELGGFVDIARMAAGDVDWDWIQSFAVDAGLGVHLNEGLRVVGEALEIDLPYDPSQSSRLWRRLWSDDSRLRGKSGITRKVRTHYWIPFTMRGRRSEAVRWWSHIVFPPPEMIEYLHPEASGPYLWKLASYRGRLAWARHRRNIEQRRSGALKD